MRKSRLKNPVRVRTGRTRSEILSSAENLFSSLGFATTRLEDVADEVGLTRAALFYYFRDKQTLFDAMVTNAFESLNHRLHEILDATDRTIPDRIEQAVEVWVDAIAARPTLARLILRFVADGYEQASQRIFWDDQLLPQKFFSLFEEGKHTGVLKPLHDDPFHAASSVVGTTVFYIGALTTLIPEGMFEPLAPEQLSAHKRESVRSVRRLLGIRARRRGK